MVSCPSTQATQAKHSKGRSNDDGRRLGKEYREYMLVDAERQLQLQPSTDSQGCAFSGRCGLQSWLSTRGDTITSVVDGEWQESVSKRDEFFIGQKAVLLAYLDAKRLKELMGRTTEAGSKAEVEAADSFLETRTDDKATEERLQKFRGLLEANRADLCLAESVASGIPAWQIQEFDSPAWNRQTSLANETFSPVMHHQWRVGGKNKKQDPPKNRNMVVLIQLSRQGYSMQNILPALIPAIQFDGKFILVMSISSPHDSSLILPTAYLIDALNKSKIRKAPIDLLLLDRFSEESMRALQGGSDACEMYIWGEPGAFHHFPAQLLTGVFDSSTVGRAAHFILDSSADVQTAVDSISANVWSSGAQVNLRGRSLLFVHQPVYNTIIEFLKKKITLLKISADSTLKSSDFIKRSTVSIDASKVLAQGVKTLPEDSDFTGPTLIYDIGTSCDLIASMSPCLGHLLAIIPYRSTPELLSLANNHGHRNEVFIYASNAMLIKEIAKSIQGREIWVNSNGKHNGRQGLEDINNWAWTLLASDPKEDTREGKEEGALCLSEQRGGDAKDEFLRAVLGAEKSLKSWSSLPNEKRHSMAARALHSTLKDETKTQQQQRLAMGESESAAGLVSDLMRVAGRVYFNDDNDPENFTIRTFKSFGLVGIVLVNPAKMSIPTSIIPILVSVLKGNAAIVVSVSSAPSPSIVQACSSALPVGVVNFITAASVPDALSQLSQQGKVALLWMIQAQGESSRVDQIPMTAFSRVIVDHADYIGNSFVSRSKHVEISKTIHF